MITEFSLKKDFIKVERSTTNYKFLKNELKKYLQHGNTSIYSHSRNVAFLAYKYAINHNKSNKIDINLLVSACMMHDFFMYDWHVKSNEHGLHGYTHPHTAALNAQKYCMATEKEQKIIETHMWPLTLTKIPRSREGWILCICDKFEALHETFHHKKRDCKKL